MTSAQRLRSAAAWACFLVGYFAAWFLSSVLPTPLVWYLPVERRFVFAVHPLELAADFYGRVLLCLAVGAFCFAAAKVWSRRSADEAVRSSLSLLTTWFVGILVLTAGLYAWTLSRREPLPAPLPEHAARP